MWHFIMLDLLGLQLSQVFKIHTIFHQILAQVFFCEFCEISKNNFSYRTPAVAASVLSSSVRKEFEATSSMQQLQCSYFNIKNINFQELLTSNFDTIALMILAKHLKEIRQHCNSVLVNLTCSSARVAWFVCLPNPSYL